MKKGESVRVIQPVLEGEILRIVWNEQQDEKKYLVALIDANGKSRERWLNERQVEAV